MISKRVNVVATLTLTKKDIKNNHYLGQAWWLTSVISATQEREDGGSKPTWAKKLVRSHFNKQVCWYVAVIPLGRWCRYRDHGMRLALGKSETLLGKKKRLEM
jgi:hypothetical protein